MPLDIPHARSWTESLAISSLLAATMLLAISGAQAGWLALVSLALAALSLRAGRIGRSLGMGLVLFGMAGLILGLGANRPGPADWSLVALLGIGTWGIARLVERRSASDRVELVLGNGRGLLTVSVELRKPVSVQNATPSSRRIPGRRGRISDRSARPSRVG